MLPYSRSALMACGFLFVSVAAHAQTFTVSSAAPVFSTGILAAPGQTFTFQTTGSVNLATLDGIGPGYITNADGTILTAPTPGGGSYEFFTAQPVRGINPVVGGKKFIDNYSAATAPKIGGAYGALYAGFAPTLTPTEYTDFTSGFTLLGQYGSVTSPFSGGYLFLTVNDINGFDTRIDNAGSFQVTAVPEPGILALFLGTAPRVIFLCRRRK